MGVTKSPKSKGHGTASACALAVLPDTTHLGPALQAGMAAGSVHRAGCTTATATDTTRHRRPARITRTQPHENSHACRVLGVVLESAQTVACETLVEQTSVRLGEGCFWRDDVSHGRITAADEQRQNCLSVSLSSCW